MEHNVGEFMFIQLFNRGSTWYRGFLVVLLSRFNSMLPTGFNGVSSQTHAPCGEKNTTVMPPSFMEDTAATVRSTSKT